MTVVHRDSMATQHVPGVTVIKSAPDRKTVIHKLDNVLVIHSSREGHVIGVYRDFMVFQTVNDVIVIQLVLLLLEDDLGIAAQTTM